MFGLIGIYDHYETMHDVNDISDCLRQFTTRILSLQNTQISCSRILMVVSFGPSSPRPAPRPARGWGPNHLPSQAA